MKILTVEDLKNMSPGIFAKGEVVDGPGGCNMTNSGRTLRWVATRGDIHDWAIYVHFAQNDWGYVRGCGDKVMNAETIRRLVPCDDEAFAMYRY